ncbi:MAG TPA: hypothetical protein VIH18_04595 [Candidatus Binatia bacterium]|jgi:hypothetical protein
MANTQAKPDLRIVTIAIVRKGAEAQRIQDKLKSAGIESFLATERSFAINKSRSKELGGAVKVQVRRSDVQSALRILGAVNLAASSSSWAEVAGRKSPNPRLLLLKDSNQTVPALVVIAVIIAALILFLS